MLQDIHNILERGFAGKTVAVIGDLMLDKYLMGDVERVSPEAPVPVLHLKDEKNTLGGAGNVALNLNGLGVSVELFSVIGKDVEGVAIKKMLSQKGLSSDYVLVSPEKPTITKTRIVGERQQIVRVDKESPEPISPRLESQLIENFKELVNSKPVDAVILSDYAKGVISESLCRLVIAESNKRNMLVLVDPKGKHFGKYENATVLMPNDNELLLACDKHPRPDETLQEVAITFFKQLKIKHLVVTRGEHGILHITTDYSRNIPTRAREVYDVSGAGDTVIALTTAGLISDLPIEKALELANLAAGFAVSRFGTHPISLAELKKVINNQSANKQTLPDEEQLESAIKRWRDNGQKMVFTNGCFDIIHAGHIHLLQQARAQGDKLIVGLNTDASVRQLKGEGRPINSLEDRISVLKAIACVDGVISFGEATPLQLIKKIKPDVLVKGADYAEDEIVGAKQVQAHGGQVVRIPLVEGKSTTELLRQGSGADGKKN